MSGIMRTPATYTGAEQEPRTPALSRGEQLSRTQSARSQITKLTPGHASTFHLSKISTDESMPEDVREAAKDLAQLKHVAADLNQGLAELQAALAEEQETLAQHRRTNPMMSPPATGGGGGGMLERGVSIGTMQPPPATSPRRAGGGAAGYGTPAKGVDASQSLRAASMAQVAGARWEANALGSRAGSFTS